MLINYNYYIVSVDCNINNKSSVSRVISIIIIIINDFIIEMDFERGFLNGKESSFSMRILWL